MKEGQEETESGLEHETANGKRKYMTSRLSGKHKMLGEDGKGCHGGREVAAAESVPSLI